MKVALYDTKSYDRQYLENARGRDQIDWTFYEFRLSTETVGTAAGHQAVCVFVNDRVDAPCVEALKQHSIQHIALRCAGFNNVDFTTAAHCGISVSRVPAYSPHAVAEHTIALLLTLNRHTHRAHNRVRERNFSLAGLVGFDIHGKTAGIIGTGKIGRIVAEILRGFGAKVLAHDPMPQDSWALEHGVEYVQLQSLLQSSDIISLHSPLTPETLHLFDEESFALLKEGAYLINTSRGKLIDTTALIKNLKAGRLGGVALDVYEEEEGVFFEDLSDCILADDELSRLLTFPNVLITSHQAFLTHEALSEIARVTTENLVRKASGKSLLADTSVK